MQQAVMIGAGNIGRGFIGQLLSQGGYHVVFADVNRDMIRALNESGGYTIHVMDAQCRDIRVEPVSAVDAAEEGMTAAIASCSLVTTAVGLSVLPRLAPALAAGITARRASGCVRPLQVISCENALRASSQLKEAVYALLDTGLRAFCDQYVGFPDCSVDRIVPPVRQENPVNVAVEEHFEWCVERGGFRGPMPELTGMTLVEKLEPYLERKLFTLNCGHAVCAYLGRLRGFDRIDRAIADEEILRSVRGAMRESGRGLVRRFGFDAQEHEAYIERILERFRNPYLQDDVNRVGREPLRKLSPSDRMIKPMTTAQSYSIDTPNLALGVAAALHYNEPDDPQSRELQAAIADLGVKKTLEKFCGLSADSEAIGQIADLYAAVG